MTGRMSDIVGSALGMSPEQGASGQEGQETDVQKSQLAKLLQEFSRQHPRTRWVTPVEGLPPIKEPPPLGMTPYIQGPDTARYMEQIRSLNPRIMEQLGNITTGPNYTKIEDILGYQDKNKRFMGDGFDPFPRTDNLGLFNSSNGRSIYLNPHMRGRKLFKILAHELGHSAGANEESAGVIEGAADSFFTDNLPIPHQESVSSSKRTQPLSPQSDASRARRRMDRYRAAERERRRRLR
tara:strand:+ start:52 stop:765 length:714 start_codon:yes stop_codon:yes gene_type:complete